MSDVAQVRRYLADIPDLVIEVEHYLTPGSAPKDPDARHGTTIYKLPIVPEIADLLDTREKDVDEPSDNRTNGERRTGVLRSLGLWVSLAFAEFEDLGHTPRPCCPPHQHTIVGEANWLTEYAAEIVELHPDFPHDIETLWTELRKACRIRREYQPKCPYCNWQVEAIHGDDNTPAWWRCTGCAKTWVRDAEVTRFALTQPKMPLSKIAAWLGLPLRTLHNWRQQGRFTTDSRGLAEVEHVKRAAEAAGRISA